MTLIIGASGHIGAHLVRKLIAAGHRVRAFVRKTSRLDGLAGLDVDLVYGDVLDLASIEAAMRGCETVFHLAAPTRLESDLMRIVMEGTRNVLECAENAKVRRAVYTSSAVTIGFSEDPRQILDEKLRRPVAASAYHVAKCAAEEYAMSFSKTHRTEVVVVNPSTVVGSLDYRTTPSNMAVRRCLDKGLPFVFDSGLTIAPADDVARGHLLAMERGQPGEAYILGGERISIHDHFRVIARCCGRPEPTIRLPRVAMLGAAVLFSAARKLGVRKIPFDYTQAKQLVGKYGYYSSEKARVELGYTWASAQTAVENYVDWARLQSIHS